MVKKPNDLKTHHRYPPATSYYSLGGANVGSRPNFSLLDEFWTIPWWKQ